MEILLNCPITGLSISIDKGVLNFERLYILKINGKEARIRLPFDYKDWRTNENFIKYKYIIAGLLLNEELFQFDESWHLLTLENLVARAKEIAYPFTPKEKYDNLFTGLFALQNYDGQQVNFSSLDQDLFYKKHYFRTINELNFYAKSLHNDGLINISDISSTAGVSQFNITYKGLSYALSLENEGKQSKNCFIAMSFGVGMSEIRQSIKNACVSTGYSAILVDEDHYESDKTINDAIIANLKKSRFCIADFTEQKDGVYFESGYALGQGKQVIYSCHSDWFDKTHFDLNHFPHIIYKSSEELQRMLINKIEAWIR